ncbi:MAG: DUF4388 domain-containing protein [Sulfolobales archaeon]|nr:DUF4388 domain-containing protein [Sulfolobales archaeon]
MPVYTTKLTVSLSLREVREVFDDPFRFAGVSGHISLLMGLRSQDEEPFFFDQADSPPTRFRASFLLGTPKGQTVTYFGTFEKVQLPSFDMISYKGVEDRRRFEFQIDISLKETGFRNTTVTFSAVSNFKVDFLSRLTGKAPSYYMGQHIFEQHFIPYLRWAEAAKRSQDIVKLTLVFEMSGQLNELVKQVLELFKEKGRTGLIEFRSEDLRGWLLVRNGAVIAAYSYPLSEFLDEQTVISSILKAEDRVTLRAYWI